MTCFQVIRECVRMGRTINSFKGVNKVYAQCIKTCKQFENVILVNCHMITTRPHQRASDRYKKRTVSQI
jgi:hypothetical protein